MAFISHTYGPTCLLRPDPGVTRNKPPNNSEDPPKIRAQFFYSSALPIDDPLSAVPSPQTSKSTGPSRVPPKAFSLLDNIALEEAWQKYHEEKAGEKADARQHKSVEQSHEQLSRYEQSAREFQGTVIGHDEDVVSEPRRGVVDTTKEVPPFTLGSGESTAEVKDTYSSLDQVSAVPIPSRQRPSQRSDLSSSTKSYSPELSGISASVPPHSLQQEGLSGEGQRKRTSAELKYGSSPSQRSTTGRPFARAPTRVWPSKSPALDPPVFSCHERNGDSTRPSSSRGPGDTAQRERHSRNSSVLSHATKSVMVPVGISRLHFVEVPELQMGPIYWDPVHDVSAVVRGTWFYKDTMTPVEPNLANQIEEGYEYIKPWTVTYEDELNSCLDVGPDAELKVCHRIWPEVIPQDSGSRPMTAKSKQSLLDSKTEDLSSGEKHWQRAIREAKHPDNRSAGILASQQLDEHGEPLPLHIKDYIIFANCRDAQILRPYQLPSKARGRRPLETIRKGRSIGIPIVRGFDHKAWEKMNVASSRQQTAFKTRRGPEILRTLSASADRQKYCGACLIEGERPTATDLVLVIHGIGQKMAERVEGFHFTHAINDFRRRMNEELESEPVRPWLRPNLGSIMVLPVNWRTSLRLHDDLVNPTMTEDNASSNQYTLGDITAQSIPAVRSLVSDVLLDIPYYLSHHKPRIIQAVIREANRIYRLWCKHNAGFHQYGRVHILAHSLGSVMALDILSNQPTSLPRELDPTIGEPSVSMFDFDTKSLFFCGSPAGFFLLLNKASLLPRKGRNKVDAGGDDFTPGLADEAGTFGCLAVDNFYNILHYNDPVACLVNACVDANYAASLAPALVPSASTTWLQSFSSIFTSKPVASSIDRVENLARPSAVKMPSQVELEIHNFSREEVAEKRMFLLNDNGQIDYYLMSGGGPLEIQYLNMLGAHSSYWTMKDFLRFLVVEIGREEGRETTVPSLRATKKGKGVKR